MKLLIEKSLFALLAFSFFSQAFADGKPYGKAGCGLGSVIMGKEKFQVFAATTNGTFYSQIFGITFGISNCTDGGVVKANKQAALFIEGNKLALETDIAKGQGETIVNLSKIYACSNSQDLGLVLKNNASKVLPLTNGEAQILNVLKQDQKIVKSCKLG